MRILRAALALALLACGEPTAIPGSRTATAAEALPLGSSFSINTADGTIYVRLAPTRDDIEAPRDFMRRMFASADAAGARRLVVDLRGVTGTDARVAVPLLRGILIRDRFARGGGLIVVTGADSFSPLQNTASLLTRYAAPRIVSEYPAG